MTYTIIVGLVLVILFLIAFILRIVKAMNNSQVEIVNGRFVFEGNTEQRPAGLYDGHGIGFNARVK